MPFIPHTQNDVDAMLKTLGVNQISDLFDEVPQSLLVDSLPNVPEGLSEIDLSRLMQGLSDNDGHQSCFAGAGSYQHYIPSAVWDIVGRGEFMTAYTPYQAEASQGTLQLIYEYQTMMASLMGLDVSNASLYDGASALAEAVLMAVRCQRKNKSGRVLVAGTVHPSYRDTVVNIVNGQGIELVELSFDKATGLIDKDALEAAGREDFVALVVSQPNFFGGLEAVDELTNWAHAKNALVIGVMNPIAASLIKPPGQWGTEGADIACGEGQPLGVPVAGGGPYFGFLCTKKPYVRQMPGRLVGKTVDRNHKVGYSLTLQAREQHIRRSKATSNICTNQGLLVTAATIYMSLMGFSGIQEAAKKSHQNTSHLISELTQIPGVSRAFTGPYFHEHVLVLDKPIAPLLDALTVSGILGGVDISHWYPELGQAMLVCATEMNTPQQIKDYSEALNTLMSQEGATC